MCSALNAERGNKVFRGVCVEAYDATWNAVVICPLLAGDRAVHVVRGGHQRAQPPILLAHDELVATFFVEIVLINSKILEVQVLLSLVLQGPGVTVFR